ncbi:MAG TPA: cysteine methyltransferase [Clostridiales bacterium UBA8960]|nr:cysteine methyltransferase [Clostridiales bacterium UBA8960]
MIFKYLDTPIGEMVAVANDEGICMLEFKDMKTLELDLLKIKEIFGGEPISPGKNEHLDLLTEEVTAYFQQKLKTFTVPVVKWGTSFQNQVWEALETIPFGETRSYFDVAKQLSNPKAVRAVGMANGKNKIAIIIPCHRVIGAEGKMTGYAGGLWRKEWLLNHEKSFL